MSNIVVPEGGLKASLVEVNNRRTVHCTRCDLNELRGILEPVINFIPLESKKYPSTLSSQTMGVWETEGRAGIQAM